VLLAPALLLAGCFQELRQSTVHPESDTTRVIQNVYRLVTWIDAAIFVFVFALLVWAVVRYRERKGEEKSLPKQVHGSAALEVVWTVVPAVILVFIAVPTWEGIFRTANPPAANTITVKVVGRQWWWEFEYPELGLVTASEMHVPLGKSVIVKNASADVIHSFWVPRLAGKVDLLPGKINETWFTPEKAGHYYGQCAEFCGTSHANMRFHVIVESQADFDAWVARTKQPQKPETAEAKEGEALFAAKGCIACHTITGRPDAVGKLGPNLTNLKDRTSIASAMLKNDPATLAHWVREPLKLKPGVKMILPQPVSEEESKKIAAYLMSPTAPAAAAVPAPAAPAAPAVAAMTPTPAAVAGPAAGAAQALAIMQAKNCWVCHVIPDMSNAKGTIGPSLAGLMKRPKMVGGLLDTNEANLRKWLANPQAVKPGTAMVVVPPLTPAEVDVVARHLIATYK
jgi:cytochrome c oxidase subunit 2